MANALSDYKVEITDVEPCVKKLHVEIPAERVKDESEKQMRELGKRAHIQGFRPGKAPRPVLERMYADAVLGEVGEKLIHESYEAAVSAHKLEVFGNPTFEQVNVEKGKPISYAALIETAPNVPVPDFSGWEFEREIARVTDKEIESVIDSLRDAQAELVPVDGRGAKEGDHLFLDFSATVDGKEEPRLSGVGQQIILSESGDELLADFHKNLFGMGSGQEKGFTVKISKQFPDPALAEKEAEFKVTVTAVKEKKLPELTDEFVAAHSPYHTIDEMRKNLRESGEERERDRGEEALRRAVLAKFRASADFRLPPKMLTQYTEMYANRIIRQTKEWGLDLQNQPDFDRKKFTRGAAEKGEEWAREDAIIESIAKENKLEPDPATLERLQREYAEFMRSNDRTTRYNAALFMLKDALRESVFKHIYSKTRITDRIVDKIQSKENG